MRFGAVKRAAPGGRRPRTLSSRETRHNHGAAWRLILGNIAMGSYMPISIKSMIACGCLVAVAVLTVACSPRRIPPMTVSDLMEDRVLLDGVLMKCNRDPDNARSNSNCMNARIASERLAARTDPAVEAKRAADFEKSREQLRALQDKQRQEHEAKKPKVDVYNLPVIPVEPAEPPKDPQSPTLSQTNR
jgi:hypothetical protein